jgi:hypothetical protein
VSIAKAIHVFTLTPWGPDKTEVVSRESMNGPLLSWFYASDDLKNTNDKQLANMALRHGTAFDLAVPSLRMPTDS